MGDSMSDKPVGRPTKYKEEYCEQIIKFMKDGSSKVEFCAEIGIVYDTFLDWKEKYPAFSESIKKADLVCQAWWEKNGRKATFGEVEGFNSTGFIFQMKNRFPRDYKDKQEVEHSGEIDIADRIQRARNRGSDTKE